MHKLKKGKGREVRQIGEFVFVEDRKFFTFHHIEGHLIETKAVTKEEALAHVELCLGKENIILKEAA
jgi:hypothetical protein